MNFAVSIFKFFASLRFAILLLFLLAVLFAVGTFLESAYATETAKLLIYQSPWLSLLLILLALNVAASALDRLPWKKKHVGFVITHTGIIVILAGSLLTRAYGIEGQIAIEEGKDESRMVLSEPLLQLFSKEKGPLTATPLHPRPFAWQGRERLGSAPDLWLLLYYPKASRETRVEKTSNGPAALRVTLESSFMKTNEWLILGDPDRQEIFLGPAELRFSREKIPPPKAASLGNEGSLEFRFRDDSVVLSLPQEIGQKIPLQGTPYAVQILRILKDAVVEGEQLVDRSPEWNNPACELLLEGEGVKEKHTVFSNFPDFPTLHGMKPSETGAHIFYRRSAGQGPGAKNELRFIPQEDQLPLFQIRKGESVQEGEVRLGKEVETGWMDFKFRVDQYFPHSRVNTFFHEEPVQSEADGHLSALQLEMELQGEKRIFWLGQGEVKEITIGGKTFEVLYGLKKVPVGFRLELRDFRVENYPGTNRPASFESDVILKDDFAGVVRNLTIRMNQPLKYRGFKVFQSGYQQPEGAPEISIFTVAKDPGIPVKYGGAVILVAGIATMFYTRRFSSRLER